MAVYWTGIEASISNIAFDSVKICSDLQQRDDSQDDIFTAEKAFGEHLGETFFGNRANEIKMEVTEHANGSKILIVESEQLNIGCYENNIKWPVKGMKKYYSRGLT